MPLPLTTNVRRRNRYQECVRRAEKFAGRARYLWKRGGRAGQDVLLSTLCADAAYYLGEAAKERQGDAWLAAFGGIENAAPSKRLRQKAFRRLARSLGFAVRSFVVPAHDGEHLELRGLVLVGPVGLKTFVPIDGDGRMAVAAIPRDRSTFAELARVA
ncbi:hypothetical protein [Chelatococcus reniformis]|uniref:Uncharacterized protein n=1 Tax=Chelatococcus reniformis TaxID=1494448 RepID=A0A916UW02_9HYPH|nr:hypothetical protein [Chelatococcus reniformis]GGC90660.1 hypothetical protein GCM10010994_55570 [Chelatococcus reniformis]